VLSDGGTMLLTEKTINATRAAGMPKKAMAGKLVRERGRRNDVSFIQGKPGTVRVTSEKLLGASLVKLNQKRDSNTERIDKRAKRAGAKTERESRWSLLTAAFPAVNIQEYRSKVKLYLDNQKKDFAWAKGVIAKKSASAAAAAEDADPAVQKLAKKRGRPKSMASGVIRDASKPRGPKSCKLSTANDSNSVCE
jgi:hypothetical protein